MSYRLRVCYGKTGRLRFLGHLEVCAALERGVRRARLPVAYGQGFHPKAKLAFGPALPVGVAGQREYVDIWLTDYVAPADAVAALAVALPEDLRPVFARYVAAGAPSLASAAAVVVYTVEPVGLPPEAVRALEAGVADLAASGSIEVEKRGKTRTYSTDQALYRQPRPVAVDGRVVVELWLNMLDQAPVSPEAIVRRITGRIAGTPYLRVTRMECYAHEGDALVSLGEAG